MKGGRDNQLHHPVGGTKKTQSQHGSDATALRGHHFLTQVDIHMQESDG